MFITCHNKFTNSTCCGGLSATTKPNISLISVKLTESEPLWCWLGLWAVAAMLHWIKRCISRCKSASSSSRAPWDNLLTGLIPTAEVPHHAPLRVCAMTTLSYYHTKSWFNICRTRWVFASFVLPWCCILVWFQCFCLTSSAAFQIVWTGSSWRPLSLSSRAAAGPTDVRGREVRERRDWKK